MPLINGTPGSDTLNGGDGLDDQIYGLEGDDILRARGGHDDLFGGGGADLFRYAAVNQSSVAKWDTIQDFQVGIDKVDLRTVAASVTLTVFGGSTFINFSAGGADGLIIAAGVTLTQADVLVAGESAPGLDVKDNGPLTLPPLGDDDPLVLADDVAGFKADFDYAQTLPPLDDGLDPLVLPQGYEAKAAPGELDADPVICLPVDVEDDGAAGASALGAHVRYGYGFELDLRDQTRIWTETRPGDWVF